MSQPTKRAADWWDSPRLTSLFLALGFFLLSSRLSARPPAANASRWLASQIISPIERQKR